MHVMAGSGLTVKVQLEGALWGDGKYPGGRTSLRSQAMFLAPPVEGAGEDNNDDDGDDDIRDDRRNSVLLPLWNKARDLGERCIYDASIKLGAAIRDMPLKFENGDGDEMRKEF